MKSFERWLLERSIRRAMRGELENLVDELLATCDRTLYKLKYLK